MALPSTDRRSPRRRTLFAAVFALALSGLRAQEETSLPVRTAPADPTLAEALDDLARPLAVDGAGLAVGERGRLLHVSTSGAFTPDQQLPIASASKWLAVATILSLVDDGTLDLDATVATYLPEFGDADRKLITLRQCLSCTAGFPAQARKARGADLTLDECVRALAEVPLQYAPGTEWVYGGVTFQVAACCAVRRTGRDWHTLFAQRVAEPLGLLDTRFGALVPPGGSAGTAKNPWVAGGAVSSLRDYERFCAMLSNGGEFDGVRVLAKSSVEAMLRAATDDSRMTVRFEGFEGDLDYGLGTWLQNLPGGLVRASDAGAFGFFPWIDLDRGVYGVLAIRDRVNRVLPRIGKVQDAARAFAKSPSVAGRDEVVRIEHGGRTRLYRLHTPPGAEKQKALPLVLVFHGGGGHGEQVEIATGFSRLADRENFVAVYPDGTGQFARRLLTWNSGGIAVYASEHKVDDAAFVRAVVADVRTRVPIDPDRVFATGMSNGGMMCHRLARECADLFAGIAPVAGAMNFTEADPRSPLAVMIVHGTGDDLVRYEGGRPERKVGRGGERVDASVADAVKYYLARNGLEGEPEVTVEGKVEVKTWRGANGAAPVRLATIDGGGHAWPSGRNSGLPRADEPTDWDAAKAIWDFFASVRRPAGSTAPR